MFAMFNLWVTAKCHFATHAQYPKQLGSNTTECTELSLSLQDLYLRCIISTGIILLPTLSGSLITAWEAASPDLRQRLWSPGISPNVNMWHNQGQPSMVHPPIWMVAGKLTTPHCKKFSSTEC
jgi:hypothetical protein